MKRFLLLIVAGLMALPLSQAQDFSFSAVAPSGQTLYYAVTNDNCVEVVNPGYGTDYPAPSGDVVIPEQVSDGVNDYVVKAIAAQAFNNCAELSSIVMANTITSVGRAFEACPNLTRIVFSDSVVSFNSNVLVPSLKSITFGTLFTGVAESMFIPSGSTPVTLDTLRFRSSLCISKLKMWQRLNLASTQRVPIDAIFVPCGEMQAFFNNGWHQLGYVQSDCSTISIPLNIVSLCDDPDFNHGTVNRVSPAISYYVVDHPVEQEYSSLLCEPGEDITLFFHKPVTDLSQMVTNDAIVDHWSDFSFADTLHFTLDFTLDPSAQSAPITLYVTSKPFATLDVNNITTPLDIYGSLGFLRGRGNYVFRNIAPTIYASGLWIAGMEGDNLHSAAHRFGLEGVDYIAGPSLNNQRLNEQGGYFWNHIWKVSRQDIDNHLAHYSESAYACNPDIASWPGPYVDMDNNGSYNPLQGDYPLIRGDQALFGIFNDNRFHTESHGLPLGIDVHVMAYAFNESDSGATNPLNNTVFVDYQIFNRSNRSYDNCYLGSFVDFDLGYAYDDYVGCDVTRQMSYCYNGDEVDGPGTPSFPGNPPAQGCVVLSGANNNGDNLGMTGFLYYNNSNSGDNSEPTKASDYYNYLQGNWKSGRHMFYGGDALRSGVIDGLECDFMFPGDSDPDHIGTHGVVPSEHPEDWTEFSAGMGPGDRRGLSMSGPFTFQPGESQLFRLAFVTAQASEGGPWASVELLKQDVDQVRRQADRDTTDSDRAFCYMPRNGQPVGIEQHQTLKHQLNLFPNPTTGLVRLVSSDTEPTTAFLYDIMGHHLASYSLVNGEASIDLTSLPQGIYFLRCNGQVQRIVKQ